MPTRHAKPHSEAGYGVLAAISRPEYSTALAQTSTNNDLELATDVMDTNDQDTETQVLQGESNSDAGNMEAEESDEDAKNGHWQLAMSLQQRKRLRKQERTAPDDSDARAIERANGDPETCKSDKFLLRLCNGSNTVIVSTAYEEVAEKILRSKALELNSAETTFANQSVPCPEGATPQRHRGAPKRLPQRCRLHLLQQQSSAQTNGILKRHCSSMDREDCAPPGGASSRSQSRSGSREASNSRNGDQE
ncbi:hypothetical protein HPB50_002538 [Hyalomma asiaticum]|uniref:Uncharacterized protein n=1 Tax=Hyalomma asiaticum TaxID=266040 RepID=A0ACB7SUX5_HYAAI|nr:hypothetical protein HPB50_002538 [Hyalomma asiaticum]